MARGQGWQPPPLGRRARETTLGMGWEEETSEIGGFGSHPTSVVSAVQWGVLSGGNCAMAVGRQSSRCALSCPAARAEDARGGPRVEGSRMGEWHRQGQGLLGPQLRLCLLLQVPGWAPGMASSDPSWRAVPPWIAKAHQLHAHGAALAAVLPGWGCRCPPSVSTRIQPQAWHWGCGHRCGAVGGHQPAWSQALSWHRPS